ncbi:hypothetical protein JADG_010115 [Aureobasidium aubasidani]|nr:hypothetical protein JADG_010113 [Aureobasidium pullulans]KAG2170376.1 hypothetical protein JADG_010115 [Aureobasidium pullulans]
MINGATEMDQLAQRVDKFERHQFKEGPNARFTQVNIARQIRDLKTETLRSERAKDIKILELRITFFSLQAKLTRQENEERTRLIKIEPRTQKEKLESAMKNRSLNHIASGAMSLDLTSVEICIREAAQMEKLAKFLAVTLRVFGTRDAICEAHDSQRCLLHEPRQTCGGRGQPLYTISPLYCSYAGVLADSEEPLG